MISANMKNWKLQHGKSEVKKFSGSKTRESGLIRNKQQEDIILDAHLGDTIPDETSPSQK